MRSKVWLGSRWWWATPISDTANTSTVCICSRLFSREMETQRNSFLTFTFSREMETSWNSFLAFTFSREMEASQNSILNFTFHKRKMSKTCTVTTFYIWSRLFSREMEKNRQHVLIFDSLAAPAFWQEKWKLWEIYFWLSLSQKNIKSNIESTLLLETKSCPIFMHLWNYFVKLLTFIGKYCQWRGIYQSKGGNN